MANFIDDILAVNTTNTSNMNQPDVTICVGFVQ
jgi:hypothetical protein